MGAESSGLGSILKPVIAGGVGSPPIDTAYSAIGGTLRITLPESVWNNPSGMAIDSDGKLWIGSNDDTFIVKFDPITLSIIARYDLSQYNLYGNNMWVREVRYGNGYIFVCCMQAEVVVVIDPKTDQVVGTAVLPDNGYKARSCVTDENGALWVNAVTGEEGTSVLFKFTNYLKIGSEPLLSYVVPDDVGIEELAAGFGYVWSAGRFNNRLYRFALDNAFTTTSVSVDDGLWGTHIAFGSVWVSGRTNTYRFDPTTFPSDPIASIAMANPGWDDKRELTSDGSTIWLLTWDLPDVVRISTDLGSEAVIAALSIGSQIQLDAPSAPVFDGTSLWVCNRWGEVDGQGSIIKIITDLGNERYAYSWRGPLAYEYVDGSRMEASENSDQVDDLNAGDHIKFNSVITSSGSAITLDVSSSYTTDSGTPSVGRFTLKQGLTYKLYGHPGTFDGQLVLQWYIVNFGEPLGTAGISGPTTAVVTPGSDVMVELRIVYNDSCTTIGTNLGDSFIGARAIIEVIG